MLMNLLLFFRFIFEFITLISYKSSSTNIEMCTCNVTFIFHAIVIFLLLMFICQEYYCYFQYQLKRKLFASWNIGTK